MSSIIILYEHVNFQDFIFADFAQKSVFFLSRYHEQLPSLKFPTHTI